MTGRKKCDKITSNILGASQSEKGLIYNRICLCQCLSPKCSVAIQRKSKVGISQGQVYMESWDAEQHRDKSKMVFKVNYAGERKK
jgi:hypothetical protein